MTRHHRPLPPERPHVAFRGPRPYDWAGEKPDEFIRLHHRIARRIDADLPAGSEGHALLAAAIDDCDPHGIARPTGVAR